MSASYLHNLEWTLPVRVTEIDIKWYTVNFNIRTNVGFTDFVEASP